MQFLGHTMRLILKEVTECKLIETNLVFLRTVENFFQLIFLQVEICFLI